MEKKTIVKGLRASQEFFDKCDLVAKAESTTRNELIVSIIGNYLSLYDYLYGDDKMILAVKNNDGN